MKIGVIGTGNMGRVIIEALIESEALPPSSMIIMNRTIEKALKIKENYPPIMVAHELKKVAEKANLIFICVKPLDVLKVIEEIKPSLKKEDCVVSITSPISVKQLERLLPCSVARAIPSITNRALAGVTLLTYGDQCSTYWRHQLTEILKYISKPIVIEENITRVSSDIVSCGPAFFSYLTRKFIEGAVDVAEIDEETATYLTSEMLIGLGELLKKNIYTLATLQEKVCVKGGITGEGIAVLEEKIGNTFNLLFHRTHEKFREEVENINNQLPS